MWEAWAWEQVEVSQLHTRCPWHALMPQFPPSPKYSWSWGKGGVPGRAGGGVWPPGLMLSTLPSSGLCLALYKCLETAVPCHGAQTCPYRPRGLNVLPGGRGGRPRGRGASAGGWWEPGPEGEPGSRPVVPQAGRQAGSPGLLACLLLSEPGLGPARDSAAGTQRPGGKGQQRPWTPFPRGWPGSLPPFPAWTLSLCLPVFPYLSLS